jgi:hypothetical protein
MNQETQGYCLPKKTKGRKSRDNVPLSNQSIYKWFGTGFSFAPTIAGTSHTGESFQTNRPENNLELGDKRQKLSKRGRGDRERIRNKVIPKQYSYIFSNPTKTVIFF